jgi:hypothetical protein
MDGMEMDEGTRDVILPVDFSPGPSALSPTVRIAGFQGHRLKKLFRVISHVNQPKYLMVTKVITTKHRHWTTCVEKNSRGMWKEPIHG